MRKADVAQTHLTPSQSRVTQTRRVLGSAAPRRVAIDPASDWELNELRSRGLAGLWSARIALVLSVPFGITGWAIGADQAWLTFMVLPVVAAFFAGAFFGASIADPSLVPDESLAARRGVLVAIAAYLVLAMEIAAMSATPLETGLDFFMGSLLISGWAVFPVAFLAGILAFRAREGAYRYRQHAEA